MLSAAMGAMGWAQSNYYVSGDSPNTAGNILMNWYNDYFTSIPNTEISSAGCPTKQTKKNPDLCSVKDGVRVLFVITRVVKFP